MLSFPDISPIAIHLGPFVIRWYALAYIAGIILGYYYIRWLDAGAPRNQQKDVAIPPAARGTLGGEQQKAASLEILARGKKAAPAVPLAAAPKAYAGEYRLRPSALFFSEKAQDDIIFYAVLGIILGGRLGYVLFYNLPYFLAHPIEILHVWQGGMSFHGGLLGVIGAFYLLARKHALPFLGVMDFMACAAPIGLFFGRLANFINGELYGRVTTASWGMVFPRGGPQARYPSQLLEAFFEGIVLFLILLIIARFTRAFTQPGRLSGVFLIGYGIARFGIEYFREPDAQLGFLAFGATMGQLLCVPMILLGMLLIVQARPRARSKI